MFGLSRVATSFVGSAESAFHSSKAPSTRGATGTNAKVADRAHARVSRRGDHAPPTPNGWTDGSWTPNVSPVVEAKSPTTNKVVGAPTATWTGAKENRTLGETGAA